MQLLRTTPCYKKQCVRYKCRRSCDPYGKFPYILGPKGFTLFLVEQNSYKEACKGKTRLRRRHRWHVTQLEAIIEGLEERKNVTIVTFTITMFMMKLVNKLHYLT